MTLPSKTEPVNTGESYVTLHLKATQVQIESFQASLEIENHLVNFANYYLEKNLWPQTFVPLISGLS
ncbi:hypothetical protein [Secundilactobacillus collinoides]|uniref:hypothetical protein n=1 Tax=Secundilactobacillus collinoides TaxID=33960 RepID=UPI0006D005BD|nr:hypothetical protein [Secundilactobacillus collinoides]